MPLLRILTIDANQLNMILPASWGSSPNVLPALQKLTLISSSLRGRLPSEWARGFINLTTLVVRVEDALGGNLVASPRRLPAEWASGFPALEWLSLSVPLAPGPIPTEWVERGFPKLKRL